MLYLHHTTCISPQQTFLNVAIDEVNAPVENKLKAIEPSYEGIPPTLLRRMGKAVRIGVGAALPLLKNNNVDGIIIGTANGGMEDCIKFLNQIIQYEEGVLTPGNFVQSTANAIAGQLGLLSKNKGYNTTHVHRGLAFENALLEADMLLKENDTNTYLIGAVDEISAYNYNIDLLDNAYKQEAILSTNDLYNGNTKGSIAGEGAVMFVVNANKENAIASLKGISTIHTTDENVVKEQLSIFLSQHLNNNSEIDLLLSGENGDNSTLNFYTTIASLLHNDTAVARFKHISGEYPTASAVAVWLACSAIQKHVLPLHVFKKQVHKTSYKNILVYNNYKGLQHSFLLIEAVV